VAAVAAVVSHEVVGHICGLREPVWKRRYVALDLLRRTIPTAAVTHHCCRLPDM